MRVQGRGLVCNTHWVKVSTLLRPGVLWEGLNEMIDSLESELRDLVVL